MNIKIKKYFPDYDNKITFLDQTININFKKKYFRRFWKFSNRRKKDDIKYNFEINKERYKI